MLWNLLDSFTVHGPCHGLLMSILKGPTCTKLVRMWNRLRIPRVTMWCFGAASRCSLRYNSADAKPGFPSVESRTGAKIHFWSQLEILTLIGGDLSYG